MMENEVNGINRISSSVTKDLGQQDFLRLMVAQIQQHEPETLSQTIQSTGVHESIQQMANSLQSNQALQASALVGRKVMIPNNRLTLNEEGESHISIEIPLAVSHVLISIYDQAASLVKNITITEIKAGLFQLIWDGTGEDNRRLPAGQYVVRVKGVCTEEEIVLQTMAYANVDSVSLRPNEEGLKLNIAGIGPLSLDQVKQITV